MTTTAELLEETRVLSYFTERCHFVKVSDKKYVCIGGYTLPYNIGVTFMLWIITGSNSYEGILLTSDQLDIVKILNQQDQKIPDDPGQISWYIQSKLQSIMKTWDPADFDSIVPF